MAILCPTYRSPEPQMQDSLRAMVEYSREQGITVYSGAPLQTSVVHWSRNFIISEQIKSGKPWTHVLMVDDDMKIPRDALVRLLSHKKDIVGGICTRRTDPPRPTISTYDEQTQIFEPMWDWGNGATFEVGGIGAAFLLCTRHALEQVAQAYFDCLWEKDFYGVSEEWVEKHRAMRLKQFDENKMAFWFRFLPSPAMAIEQGEDMSFCLVARKYCGIPIYCDSSVQPGHLGTYDYGIKDFLPYQSLMRQAEVESEGMKISILCPTRGRPENVKRLIKSLEDTSEEMPEVVFYVDEDDENIEWMGRKLRVVRGPRQTLSNCWNECAKVATGNILMVAGDDIVFRSKGWDGVVKRAFAGYPDRIVMVHGQDGSPHKDKFATHPFLHRKWVDALGYITPPYFSADYCDTWINEIANLLDRRVSLPFVHEHLHPYWGKAEVDETHKEKLARAAKDDVKEKYKQLAPQRLADVEKLRAIINGESVSTGQPFVAPVQSPAIPASGNPVSCGEPQESRA